jgi:hypothetical protein
MAFSLLYISGRACERGYRITRTKQQATRIGNYQRLPKSSNKVIVRPCRSEKVYVKADGGGLLTVQRHVPQNAADRCDQIPLLYRPLFIL